MIVDEASQATPQSALLLMQKAKRFLVVGDPLQLTPVVTLPDSLSELLCGKEELLRKWSPHLHSLQQLADGANPFGAFVGPGRTQNLVRTAFETAEKKLSPDMSISAIGSHIQDRWSYRRR